MLSVVSARFTIAATRDSPGTTSLSSASRLPTRPSSPPIQVPVSEDAVTSDELLTSASSRQRNAFPVYNFIQNSSGHRPRLPLVRARYTGPIEASARSSVIAKNALAKSPGPDAGAS